VVVNDLDVVSITALPAEADAPLVVDSDAVQPFAVPNEFLQAVTRWNAEVVKVVRGVNQEQLAQGGTLQRPREFGTRQTTEYSFGLTVTEAPDKAKDSNAVRS
jgi:hypothetical protein